MAQTFYATIKGKTQGAFKGQGTGREKDKIPGVAFTYGVESPRDAASGLPTGKRQHKPVVFTKEWGAASPQLYQAIVTNETLTSVLFEFISTNALGKEEVDYIVELTNATISGFKGSLHLGEKAGPIVDSRELEVITLEFQKIAVTSVTGGTSAEDDWETPVV
jgi:type VI secretion system secreted protein Hcp